MFSNQGNYLRASRWGYLGGCRRSGDDTTEPGGRPPPPDHSTAIWHNGRSRREVIVILAEGFLIFLFAMDDNLGPYQN